MTNKEAISIIKIIGEDYIPRTTFQEVNEALDLAIKALDLVSRLNGFKYVTTEVLLREHEVAHFDIYKRGWNDAIQAVIDASDMPITDIIKAIKENEVKKMRLIDADYVLPLIPNEEIVSKSIIANAPTVEINTNDIEYKAYCKGLEDGRNLCLSEIRWTDKVFAKSNGDIIDFEGRVVGHINLEERKGGEEEE